MALYDAHGQSWSATELLSDVRRKAQLPASSVDLTDAVLMREATDVLWSFAGWAMQQGGDGRLLDLLERPVTSALSSTYRTAGEFDLPPLAIADTVESVAWESDDGTSTIGLQRVDASLQHEFDKPGSTGNPRAYALVGSRIRLYPQPTTGGVVRLAYQRRHPALIADTSVNVGTIATAAATSSTLTLTVAGLSGSADVVDVIGAYPPYRTPYVGLGVRSLVGPTLTLDAPSVYDANVALLGYRVARAGTSPYVHFPLELRAAVTCKVAANALRIVGDAQGAQLLDAQALEEIGRVIAMLSPRSKRDRPRVVNPYSHLRVRLYRGGRW